MEDIIRQAFLYTRSFGSHVADGHYDLTGPNGDIILPQVWETMIEPGWTITMHMWPISEKPKEDSPPLAEVPPTLKPPADVPPELNTKAESSKILTRGPFQVAC